MDYSVVGHHTTKGSLRLLCCMIVLWCLLLHLPLLQTQKATFLVSILSLSNQDKRKIPDSQQDPFTFPFSFTLVPVPKMEKENLFLNCTFFNTGWEEEEEGTGLMDQSDPFESALSSMVCSPTASKANGSCNGQNIVVIKELIGRLGSISNSSEISPGGYNSASASCYSTPVNSPHKMKAPAMENQRIREGLEQIRGSRVASVSCFTNNSSLVMDPAVDRGKIYGSPAFTGTEQVGIAGSGDSRENSSLSELVPAKPRKRKAACKGKGKETPASASSAKVVNLPSSTKRCKSEENSSNSEKEGVIKAKPFVNQKQQHKVDPKPPEPPKDYIHVRARRGQATDAHSLAERVRREKISERMKILQDLVPGCNKVAGKAVMLDEIINYVQSLQRQVEFLSMKLAAITPRMDCNTEVSMVKDICQSRGSIHHYVHTSESYSFPSNSNLQGAMPHFTSQSLDGVTVRNHRKQSPPMEMYSESKSQVSMFWEDDLHSVVHMGFKEDDSHKFPGILPPTQMKIEH